MQGLTISMNRQTNQRDERDWSRGSLRSLITHIVESHHAYLRKELPALDTLLAMNRPPDDSIFAEVHRLVRLLHRNLELQMRKEETILFPAILELEANPARAGHAGHSQFGSLR